MSEKLLFDPPEKPAEEALGDFFDGAEDAGLVEKNELSDLEITQAKEKILEKLRSGKLAEMQKIENEIGPVVSDQIYHSPEVLAAARESMLLATKEGEMELFCRIWEKFDIPTSIREEPEFLEAAKQTMRQYYLDSLIGGDDSYITASEIKQTFKIPDSEIEKPIKMTEETRNCVAYKIRQGEFNDVADIKSALVNLKEICGDPILKEIASQRVAKIFKDSLSDRRYEGTGQYISESSINEIYLLKNRFNIDIDSYFKDEKFLDGVKKSLDFLNGGNYSEIIPIAKIRDIFHSSNDIVGSTDAIIRDSEYIDDFKQVKATLGKNHYPTDNDSVFKIIAKAGDDWPVLGQTLRYHKLGEIEKKLDEGIRLADVWQTAKKEGLPQKEVAYFEDVFAYLGDSVGNVDKKKVVEFGEIQDNQQRLAELGKMSLSEACECVKKFGLNKGAYDYLSRRLDSYEDMISGEAVRKEYQDGKFNPIKNRNDKILELRRIEPSEINPESVKSGLLRDVYYAAMQGTPEMGAVKIATNNVNQEIVESDDSQKIRSVVEFWGYHSGVNEFSIGQYKPLMELYLNCRKQVENKYAGQGLDGDQIEHQSVLLAATRLERAYAYCGLLEHSASPYASGFDEAIAAGQLDRNVMRRMAGMRKKIKNIDFSHIDRFIGKSAYNKYGKEKRVIDATIDYLKEESQKSSKIQMAEEENEQDSEKLENNYNRAVEQSNRKKDKAKKEIQESDIPSDEKEAQLNNLEQKTAEQTEAAEQAYQRDLKYLQSRTPEQLLLDLTARKEIVDKRFEKRKSLAQKALDLYFHFNHVDGKEKIYVDVIDWINKAPFGMIKRTHRALQKGIDDQSVMMLAMAEIYGDKEKGISRNDFTAIEFVRHLIKADRVQQLVENFEKIKGIDKTEHRNIVNEIIGSNGSWLVANNFEKFDGIKPEEHLDIILSLIKGGAGQPVIRNLEKFKGLEKLLRQMIEEGRYEFLPQAMEAGFSLEEIKRFPFLVSGLVENK